MKCKRCGLSKEPDHEVFCIARRGTVKVNGKKRQVFTDEHGTIRFRCNRIIRDLLNAAREGLTLDMNQIALRVMHGRYTKNEQRQLYRLIGYSVSGYGEIFTEDEVEQ